jgi:hypothetical protein
MNHFVIKYIAKAVEQGSHKWNNETRIVIWEII